MTTTRACEQRCGSVATVFAIDPCPNGWGGHYCQPCADSLNFQVIDRYKIYDPDNLLGTGTTEEEK